MVYYQILNIYLIISFKEEEELLMTAHEDTLTEQLSGPETPSSLGEQMSSSNLAKCGSASSSSIPSVKKKKRQAVHDETEKVLQLVGEKLRAIQPEDSFDVFGKNIAHQLRVLKSTQCVFAKKLINDVLFEGEMEALTKDFKVVNCANNNEQIRKHPRPNTTGHSDAPQDFPSGLATLTPAMVPQQLETSAENPPPLNTSCYTTNLVDYINYGHYNEN